LVVGIVGSEGQKFTSVGQMRARVLIERIILGHVRQAGEVVVSSGACHLGGIDIWAEEAGKQFDCYDPAYIFPPRERSWEYGYKPRNIQIATASHIVYCLSVNQLPEEYTGMRFKFCYHCPKGERVHIKSGGCWTTKYARGLGKKGVLRVIKNYD
jgi:hypothetical protein